MLGATLVGLAFVLPSFLMVIGLSMAYVAFGGLWWMQALFYGIGAAVIAIIAIAAYKLARSTNKRDPLLWGIFAVLAVVTAWSRGRAGRVLPRGGLARADRARLAGLAARAGRMRGWPARWSASLTWTMERVVLDIGSADVGSVLLPDPALLHQGRGVRLRQRPGDRAVPEPGRRPAVRLADRAPVPGRRRRGDDHARARSSSRWPSSATWWRALPGATDGGHRHLPAGLRLHDRPGALVQAAPRQRPAQGVRPGRDGRGDRRHRGRGRSCWGCARSSTSRRR